MSAFTRLAPAKLNLTLEILGPRADGYHEIRSVVTTVSLADELTAEPGCSFVITADDGYDTTGMSLMPGDVNSVELALALMRSELAGARHEPPLEGSAALQQALSELAVRLHKRIPAAAGLGGGSSDGATALLLLNQLWHAGLDQPALHRLAEQIGSDCPLFLKGGVQSMSGRGNVLEPLPSPVKSWFCIVTPPVARLRKTALLYSLLVPSDYADGSRSAALARWLRQAPPAPIRPSDLCNVFDTVAGRAFGSLEPARSALKAAGALAVQLCGSGPSLCGLFPTQTEAELAEQALRADGHAAWAVFAPAE